MKKRTTFAAALFASAILPGCFSHGTIARMNDPKGEPFVGTRFAVMDLCGKFESETEYSIPAWLVIKTRNAVDVPVSLFWDTLFLPHDLATLNYENK